MATYESLHRQCRTLESLFDTKLTSYARLASTLSRPSDPSNEHVDVEAGGAAGARWRGMEAEVEVEELLEKLGETNAALDKVAADTENPPSQSMMRAIQRHRDVYVDYTRVRNDIDAYKSSAADSLLAERGRIDSSHRMVDETLEQAYETRSEFARQRSSLGNIQTRMVGVLNTVPGINNILSMISKRRRRDSFLIGGLIGVCIFIILMYLFR